MKILIMKEFDVLHTAECDHDASAPSHTMYFIDASEDDPAQSEGSGLWVCSLDAVARPDALEAPAVTETDVPPGIVP